MAQSQIVQIPSGYLNVVNNAVIGQQTAPQFGGSEYSGQLGKWWDLDADNIRFNSAVGTLYGGRFQYVQLSADSAVPVIGQMLFWDTTVARSLFRVTTSPTLSSDDAGMMKAGICLSASLTPGYYTVMQIPGNSGQVVVKFRASLTASGAIGSRVYVSDQTNTDKGLMDVLTTDATSIVNARYIGTAVGIPVGGATGVVDIVDVF